MHHALFKKVPTEKYLHFAYVVDGTQEDAHPALCDFDLSLDMSADATMTATTFMRGTLLYMPAGDTGPPSGDGALP